MRKSSTRSVPWGWMQEGPAKNTQPLSPWARFPYLSILELTEKEGASGMTPIQEVRCHKQVPPGLAALTSTRPCVQRVRTPQSQDSDGRPCQEEWSQPGSFLGPAGPVGVALAPEWQGEHVTGPTSVPPARSEHVASRSPKSARKPWGAGEVAGQGSCAPRGAEGEWRVTLRPRALQGALVAVWLWHSLFLPSLLTA